MVLRFKRKRTEEWLVLFVLAMPFAFALLMELFQLPAIVRYVVDIAWIILLFAMLINKRALPNEQIRTLVIVCSLFFLVGLIGFLANYQSVFYFLWGMRNNARFFVFFFACIVYLRASSAENYLRFFDVLFWVNLLVLLYQYFMLEKSGDFLGGIFGVLKGCNGYINILLCIISVRSILRYMTYREPLWQCVVKCALVLFISILTELKAFVIEMIVIILMASFMTKFSVRKVWIIVGCAAGVVLAAQGIATLFPVFDDWFSLSKILELLSKDSGYTGTDDLNRLTSVPIIWNEFLSSLWQKLFGMGLGNCDYAAFDFLISPFYHRYGGLNYTMFSTSMLLLETGLIGTVLYVGFFVAVFLCARRLRRQKRADEVHCCMAQILSVLSVMMLVYNSAMRVESAYMMYFVLALPFLKQEKRKIPEAVATDRHIERKA